MSQPDKVIAVCPSCEAKLAVPARAVGKKIRCPKCQTVVAITAEMVSVKPPTPPDRKSAAPAAATPATPAESPKRPEVSLGVENTFTGPAKKNAAPESLGDEATFGGRRSVDDAVLDDDMEIVDLSARYTIEGVLGKGGMGEVQLATDNRLKRKVAIKRVLGDMAKNQTAVRRFMTEAQSIAALNHPNIVQVYDYGRDKDGPFLILEYVAGNSLLDRCQQGAMPLDEAITLICHLCDGLSRAHELGIVHRDLKPANVLLTKDSVPKLTDFGLARMETGDTGHTMSGAVLGTLDFMPPEQRRDATQADARSDLWSLAATLYQMVTGKSPKVIRLNEVPASLQSALGKALEDKPDDRYQSVAEFRNVLREVVDESRATLTNLTEGQCPSCGTKNEGHRKFCRKCAVSLEVKCLSCSKGMPVWDEVCGSCGTKQSPLITSRKEELQQRHHQAEGFLQEGKYREASQITEELQKEADPRFQHLKKWAAEFTENVKRQQQQQQQRSGVLHKEARAHQAAHDYSSAIHALEQIPASLRSPDISDMLNQLQTQEQRSKDLYEEIRLRVERRELDGLMPRVDELLQLVPDRVDLRDLRDTLEKREQQRLASRSSATTEAQRLLDARKYAECVAVLQRVDGNLRTPEIEALQKDAASKLSRLEKLQKTIDQAVKNNQLQGLLAKVEELLLLKSDVTEVDKQLREQLLVREQKQKSQIKALLQKVQQLRKEVRFDEALEMLRRVPAELQTNQITTTIEDLQYFADQRSGAIESLSQAQDRQHIQQALTLAEEYRGMLTSDIIADTAFETAMKECRRRLDELQQAEELAIRRRQRQKKLMIIGTAVSLLLLVAVVGFVVQRQLRLTAIADAQKRGDDALQAADSKAAIEAYSEVIRLDDTVADAWAGLALAKLQQTPSNVTSAFGDLEKSAALSPDGEKLQQARRLAHARRAIERANAGSVTEAMQDVAAAEKLAAPAEEVAAAKSAMRSAYLKRAEEAVAAKQLEAALKELQQARAISPQSDQLPRVSQMIAESYLDRADASVQQSAIEPALAAIEAARALQPELPRIPELQAAALVIRAQQQLQAGDRDNASADFLEARTLSSRATGLGALAASLADGLVKRCEEAFSDASLQEATAALQTVTELDSQSVTLGSLKNRLSKVLIVEADKGLLAKEADRVALLIESLAALQLQPAEQTRLSNDLAGQYFEQCQQHVAAGDLQASISTFERLLALASVDDEKKQQAVTALLSVIEPLCLTGLQSQSPASAIEAVQSLAQADIEFGRSFLDQLKPLSDDVKDALPDGLLETPLAIAPFDTAQAKVYQQAWAEHLGVPVESTNSIGMKLVLIPPDMITLMQPIQIGVYEVTQAEYDKVIGSNPSQTKNMNGPVEMVSWNEAVAFCATLSALPAEHAAGKVYRLPRRSEWEYACRAGAITSFSFGNDESQLSDYAWHAANSGGTPHSVGTKLPNAWGLYDMHGNLWEWCEDKTGRFPWRRGGAWSSPSSECRLGGIWNWAVSIRRANLGFRVVISPHTPITATDNTASPEFTSAPPLAIAPFDTVQAKVHQKAWADQLGVPVETTNSIGMKLVVIPPGEFMMGSPASELGRQPQGAGADETQHIETLAAPFLIGVHEVTQSQYEKVMGSNPSKFKGEDKPVEMINRDDAMAFCLKLSALPAERAAGREYRLPTDTEWEYACRAGTTTAYSFGDDVKDLGKHAWSVENSGAESHSAGKKRPNGWGVFDMHGNVWEWCEEKLGSSRVGCGGCWDSGATNCRAASRDTFDPTSRLNGRGFRVVCDIAKRDAADAAIGKALPASLSEGLVAYYPFNGDAIDESGNGHNGDVKGASLNTDRHGTSNAAYAFDGKDDFIAVPHDPSLNLSPGDFSISIWASLTNASAAIHILGKDETDSVQKGQGTKWILNVGSPTGKDLNFLIHRPGNDSPQAMFCAPVNFNFGDPAWHQYVVTKTAARCSIHIDGILVSEGDCPASLDDTNTAMLTIGQAENGGWVKGFLDEIRIYNRALSVAEITALYDYESDAALAPVVAPLPAIAPFDPAKAKVYQQAWADHLGVPVESTNSIGMKLVLIPPGEFMMGSPDSEVGRRPDETHHKVTLAQPFQIGTYEVTQAEYEAVMGDNPSRFKGADNPVEQVSWKDTVAFCAKLSAIPAERAAGRKYRLPKETEWEYACRAGATTAYSFGDSTSDQTKYAWLAETVGLGGGGGAIGHSDGTTHAVGGKFPNGWGLYDMHGNVWEWCSDRAGLSRVARGGGWEDGAANCRTARRSTGDPTFRTGNGGFRVALSFPSVQSPDAEQGK